jgi:hypothetical protein
MSKRRYSQVVGRVTVSSMVKIIQLHMPGQRVIRVSLSSVLIAEHMLLAGSERARPHFTLPTITPIKVAASSASGAGTWA